MPIHRDDEPDRPGPPERSDPGDPRVLYIHPHGHPEPEHIPIGLIGLVNLLPKKAVGKYAEDVTVQDISNARVVLIDVHWFFALGVLGEVVARIRSINPDARIIVGGLTAAYFGTGMLRRFDLDYLLHGDAEAPFFDLVQALLGGRDPGPLPNMISRDGVAGPRVRIDPSVMDSLDTLTVDWFPQFRRRVLDEQARLADSFNESAFPFPHIVPVRGCMKNCGMCFGAYQDRVFPGGPIHRSPDSFAGILRAVAGDPAMSTASISLPASGLDLYREAMSDLDLDLNASLLLCEPCTDEHMDVLRSAFRGQINIHYMQEADKLGIPYEEAGFEDVNGFIERLKRHDGFHLKVFFTRDMPDAAGAFAKNDRVSVGSGADWVVSRPDINELASEEALPAQLEGMIAHARGSLAAVALSGIASAPLLKPFRVVSGWEFGDIQAEAGSPEQRLVDGLNGRILENRTFGGMSIDLSWTTSKVEHGFEAGFRKPGRPAQGRAQLVPGSNGVLWEGSLVVEEGRNIGVAPVLDVLFDDGERIALAQGSHTLFPMTRVEPGPRREVAAGGLLLPVRGEVRLWVLDRGVRVERSIRAGGGSSSTGSPLSAHAGQPRAESSPAWPDGIPPGPVVRLIERFWKHEWTLRPLDFNLTARYLALRYGADGGTLLTVVITPLLAKTGMMSVGPFTIVYNVSESAGPDDRAHAESILEAVVEMLGSRPGRAT